MIILSAFYRANNIILSNRNNCESENAVEKCISGPYLPPINVSKTIVMTEKQVINPTYCPTDVSAYIEFVSIFEVILFRICPHSD